MAGIQYDSQCFFFISVYDNNLICTNPVPFILVNADPKYTLRENGCLADIIPTLIQLMGMEQPADMTGESLLIEK